jgi:hypothetical protein
MALIAIFPMVIASCIDPIYPASGFAAQAQIAHFIGNLASAFE